MEYDESIGGLAFDAVVAKLIQARADKTKPGCGNTQPPPRTEDEAEPCCTGTTVRAQASIQKEAVKGRTVLSANKEYNFALDQLCEAAPTLQSSHYPNP